MGGIAIEKIRDGVEFVPDAAAAFRRADAQAQREFGRGIDANSTYRSWYEQMSMYDAWNAYVGGWGPYPGHSKAVHPDASFHVSGLALDSDDWVNARIVEILAENGFIRNRLYVPGEQHHFEYIRSRDINYGSPASGAGKATKENDDMQSVQVNGKIYGINNEFITHYGNPAQATITTNVYSASDEIHKLSLAQFVDLLDGSGVPRDVLDNNGYVKNPQSGRFEVNGTWSRQREILAALAKR